MADKKVETDLVIVTKKEFYNTPLGCVMTIFASKGDSPMVSVSSLFIERMHYVTDENNLSEFKLIS
jgi:hypothetical protein